MAHAFVTLKIPVGYQKTEVVAYFDRTANLISSSSAVHLRKRASIDILVISLTTTTVDVEEKFVVEGEKEVYSTLHILNFIYNGESAYLPFRFVAEVLNHRAKLNFQCELSINTLGMIKDLCSRFSNVELIEDGKNGFIRNVTFQWEQETKWAVCLFIENNRGQGIQKGITVFRRFLDLYEGQSTEGLRWTIVLLEDGKKIGSTSELVLVYRKNRFVYAAVNQLEFIFLEENLHLGDFDATALCKSNPDVAALTVLKQVNSDWFQIPDDDEAQQPDLTENELHSLQQLLSGYSDLRCGESFDNFITELKFSGNYSQECIAFMQDNPSVKCLVEKFMTNNLSHPPDNCNEMVNSKYKGEDQIASSRGESETAQNVVRQHLWETETTALAPTSSNGEGTITVTVATESRSSRLVFHPTNEQLEQITTDQRVGMAGIRKNDTSSKSIAREVEVRGGLRKSTNPWSKFLPNYPESIIMNTFANFLQLKQVSEIMIKPNIRIEHYKSGHMFDSIVPFMLQRLRMKDGQAFLSRQIASLITQPDTQSMDVTSRLSISLTETKGNEPHPPLNRPDILTLIVNSWHRLIIQDAVELLAAHGQPLPFLVPNITTGQHPHICLAPTIAKIPLLAKGGGIERRLFKGDYSIITCLKVESARQSHKTPSKSSFLNQLLAPQSKFYSLSDPCAKYGKPIAMELNYAELVWLSKETMSPLGWSRFQKYQDSNGLTMLINVHGNCAGLTDLIQSVLIPMNSFFIVFVETGTQEGDLAKLKSILPENNLVWVHLAPFTKSNAPHFLDVTKFGSEEELEKLFNIFEFALQNKIKGTRTHKLESFQANKYKYDKSIESVVRLLRTQGWYNFGDSVLSLVTMPWSELSKTGGKIPLHIRSVVQEFSDLFPFEDDEFVLSAMRQLTTKMRTIEKVDGRNTFSFLSACLEVMYFMTEKSCYNFDWGIPSETIQKFPSIMATLLRNGYSIPLIDWRGKMHPIWLERFFAEINQALKVYIVCIVGKSGTRKSTLQRHLFGRHGHCHEDERETSGMTVSLHFLNSGLRGQVGAEAILVLDTEGLSPDSQEHVVRFAVSMSNFILVNTMTQKSKPEVTNDVMRVVVEGMGVSPISYQDALLICNNENEGMSLHDCITNAVALAAKQIGDRALSSVGVKRLFHRAKTRTLLQTVVNCCNDATPSNEYFVGVENVFKDIIDAAKTCQNSIMDLRTWSSITFHVWRQVSKLNLNSSQEISQSAELSRCLRDEDGVVASVKEFVLNAFLHHRNFIEEEICKMRCTKFEFTDAPAVVQKYQFSLSDMILQICDLGEGKRRCLYCQGAVEAMKRLNAYENGQFIAHVKAKGMEHVKNKILQRHAAYQLHHQREGWLELLLKDSKNILDRIQPSDRESRIIKMTNDVWGKLQETKLLTCTMRGREISRLCRDETRVAYQNTPDLAAALGQLSSQTGTAYITESNANANSEIKKVVQNVVLGRMGRFEIGSVQELKGEIDSVVAKNPTGNDYGAVHLAAMREFHGTFRKKDEEWFYGACDAFHLKDLEYKQDIRSFLLNGGMTSTAFGQIFGSRVASAIERQAKRKGDEVLTKNTLKLAWMQSPQTIRMKYFSEITSKIIPSTAPKNLKAYIDDTLPVDIVRNYKRHLILWMQNAINSRTIEYTPRAVQAFQSYCNNLRRFVVESLQIAMVNKTQLTSVVSHLKTKLGVEDEDYSCFQQYQECLTESKDKMSFCHSTINSLDSHLNSLFDKCGGLRYFNPPSMNDDEMIALRIGCLEMCGGCGALCWGEKDHYSPHYGSHQPQGMFGRMEDKGNNPSPRATISRSFRKSSKRLSIMSCRDKKSGQSSESGKRILTPGERQQLLEPLWNYTFNPVNVLFDDLMLWFFLNMHEELGKRHKANKPLKSEQLKELMRVKDLQSLDAIRSSIEDSITIHLERYPTRVCQREVFV